MSCRAQHFAELGPGERVGGQLGSQRGGRGSEIKPEERRR